MHIEIERKFLVIGDYKPLVEGKIGIKQGYLSRNKNSTVRIRITNSKGFITVKGESDSTGRSRFEWEKEISRNEAELLLGLCEGHIIEKTRYVIDNGFHVYEIDEFEGKNKGLVMVEVELKSENEQFEMPPWMGKEVTNNPRYYNSYLSKHPFTEWKADDKE